MRIGSSNQKFLSAKLKIVKPTREKSFLLFTIKQYILYIHNTVFIKKNRSEIKLQNKIENALLFTKKALLIA